MPNNNIISKTLDIKDKNITFGFSDDVLTKERIGGERCFVYHGGLSYTPIACECCGHRNENKIINYGFTTTRTLLNRVSNYQTYLELKRQRFLCKHCGSTFVAQTNLVGKNMTISKPLLYSIALAFKQKIAMKDIAENHDISFKTVERELNKCAQNIQMNFNRLPETLLIDEFKGTKDTSGSFCFVCADGETGKLFEILDNRRNFKLVRYFMRFSREARRDGYERGLCLLY